jgi:hypothetical protein
MALNFKPVNDLEVALVDAQERRLSVSDFLRLLSKSQVFVLLDKQIDADVTWDNSANSLILGNAEGVPMLAVFTSTERSSAWSAKFPQFAFGILTDFAWLLKGIQPTSGIIMNPGSAAGLEIPPWGIAQLKSDLHGNQR